MIDDGDTPARFDAHAERAVIGAALLDLNAYALCAAVVRPADFYLPAHVRTWEAMARLTADRRPTNDVTLVLSELRTMGANVGSDVLAEITDAIPTVAHCEHHARIVADLATARAVEAGARRTLSYARTARHSGADCAAFAMREALAAQGDRTADELVPMEEAVRDAFVLIEDAETRGQRLPGYSTGFPDVDRFLGGFERGQQIIVGGRPGDGKTALALQLAMTVAREHGAVLFVSLEMLPRQLGTRAMSSDARIDSVRMRTLRLDGDDMKRLTQSAGQIYRLPIWFTRSFRTTVSSVRAHALRLQARTGIAMIVIDYLQLMQAEGDHGNREREVAEISRGLKLIATELQLPLLLLSQLNRRVDGRGTKDRAPRMTDLRESGAIEQDADIILLLNRPCVYDDKADRSLTELVVAKQRNGPTGTVKLRYIHELTRFESYTERAEHPAHYSEGTE